MVKKMANNLVLNIKKELKEDRQPLFKFFFILFSDIFLHIVFAKCK